MKTMTWIRIPFLAGMVLAGCGAGAPDPEADARPELSESDAGPELSSNVQSLGTCFGSSCNGRDPGQTGCEADAFTVASAEIFSGGTPIGKVAIRRSPSCNAVWTRTSSSSGAVFIRSELSGAGVTTQGASFYAVTGFRSPMIGVVQGQTYRAVGGLGSQYGYYPNVGSVSTTF